MHVDKVALKLDEIKILWAEVRECSIAPKVATARDQNEMRERIEAVFDRYEIAIENDVEYIPMIRKELNRIIFTLNRWIEYDGLVFEKALKKLSRFL